MKNKEMFLVEQPFHLALLGHRAGGLEVRDGERTLVATSDGATQSRTVKLQAAK
jgi:hypothetical protein